MSLTLKESFDLYKHLGSQADLSEEEFNEYWSFINEDDREWWLNQFQEGKCNLTRRLLVEKIDMDGFAERHPQIAMTFAAWAGEDRITAFLEKFKKFFGEMPAHEEALALVNLVTQIAFPRMHVAYIDRFSPSEDGSNLQLKRDILVANRDAQKFYDALSQLPGDKRAGMSIRFIMNP